MTRTPPLNHLISTTLLGLALLMIAPVQAGTDWLISTHPCPGPNRTDAFQQDSDGTLWVGCGTNPEGFGLFTSPDGGDTWLTVSTSPPDVMEDFRVYTLTRGHDDALYASGVDPSGTGFRSVRLDTTGTAPYTTTANLIAVSVVGRQFNVGGYAELSDGRALANSETSGDRLYRPDAATGASAGDWTIPSVSSEVYRNLISFDDGFYASGSRIGERPRVFLPPQSGGVPPWQLQEVILDNTYDGEMWAIAVNEQRVVTVGVDQDSDTGKIYVSGSDIYNAGDYTEFNLPDIIGSGGIGTWARGVCMRNDVIVVVGERQPLSTSTGRVMISTDGGISFSNITPDDPPRTINRCAIDATGLVTVVGAAGFVGRYSGALVPDEIFMDDFEVNSYIPLR